jgi:hypothetical protein
MRFQRQFVGLLLLALFVSACGGRAVVKDRGEGEGRAGLEAMMNEDFDPLTLQDDDIELEGPRQRIEAGWLDALMAAKKDTIAEQEVEGYRVQLFMSEDPQQAREVRDEALLKFDHEVYLIYDAPRWKVRVGDFLSFTEAEKVQQQAQAMGFRDAWVVRTKVDSKRAYEARDLPR